LRFWLIDLEKYGFQGHVRPTPGHTAGSISVELTTQEALVGDLVASGILLGGIAMKGRAKRPPFEDDPSLVAKELQRMVDSGMTQFYMGHGGPLPALEVRRHIATLVKVAARSAGSQTTANRESSPRDEPVIQSDEFRNNALALEAFTHFRERDYTAVETPRAIIRLIDTGAGEPAFIFLHYWGGSARTWAAVIQRLKDKARCIALNQRGWGGSVAKDGRYDLEAMADDVEAIIRSLEMLQVVGLRRLCSQPLQLALSKRLFKSALRLQRPRNV
jgi:hypothetical protein